MVGPRGWERAEVGAYVPPDVLGIPPPGEGEHYPPLYRRLRVFREVCYSVNATGPRTETREFELHWLQFPDEARRPLYKRVK